MSDENEVKQILAECYSKTSKFNEADTLFKKLLKLRHSVVKEGESIHGVDNAVYYLFLQNLVSWGLFCVASGNPDQASETEMTAPPTLFQHGAKNLDFLAQNTSRIWI